MDVYEKQKEIFTLFRKGGLKRIDELRPQLNLLDFSSEQADTQLLITRIQKALIFCNEKIEEAEGVLNGR